MAKEISQAEQDAALSILRAQAPGNPQVFPGAASTRLVGRFATLSLSIGVTLLCFHYELSFQQEFADATAHSDFWRQRLPLTEDWEGRVQGYLTAAQAATYLGVSGNLTGDPAPMTLTLYAGASSLTPFFTGTCYAQRTRILVPMAMVTQEVELVANTQPTVMT